MKKTCSKCKVEKPLEGYYNEASRADGRKAVCKKCCAAKVLEWRNVNREQHLYNKRKNRIQNKYKIKLSEYEEYLSKPCGMCGKDSEVLDHNHDTGKPRGGLCSNCNRALGLLCDSPTILKSAYEYLIKHGSYGDKNESNS